MNITIVIVSVTIILVRSTFKLLMHKFESVEFAMDLHVGGIAMMLPLPFTKHEMAEVLTYVIVLSTLALILTAACYVNEQMNPRNPSYRKMGLGIGVSFFAFGTVLASVI